MLNLHEKTIPKKHYLVIIHISIDIQYYHIIIKQKM